MKRTTTLFTIITIFLEGYYYLHIECMQLMSLIKIQFVILKNNGKIMANNMLGKY